MNEQANRLAISHLLNAKHALKGIAGSEKAQKRIKKMIKALRTSV